MQAQNAFFVIINSLSWKSNFLFVQLYENQYVPTDSSPTTYNRRIIDVWAYGVNQKKQIFKQLNIIRNVVFTTLLHLEVVFNEIKNILASMFTGWYLEWDIELNSTQE